MLDIYIRMFYVLAIVLFGACREIDTKTSNLVNVESYCVPIFSAIRNADPDTDFIQQYLLHDDSYTEAIVLLSDVDIEKIKPALGKWRFDGRALGTHDMSAIFSERLEGQISLKESYHYVIDHDMWQHHVWIVTDFHDRNYIYIKKWK